MPVVKNLYLVYKPRETAVFRADCEIDVASRDFDEFRPRVQKVGNNVFASENGTKTNFLRFCADAVA